MKAYVLHNIGELKYESVENPLCPEGWALVRVMAAGICSSDLPRIFTKGTYHFPTIPGHEFSGIVEKTGSITDRNLIGQRVGVFPLIPCRHCSQCEREQYELCEHYDYLGSRRDGGFAELVAVPIWNLVQLPDNISFSAGAMLEPLCVGLHAVRRVKDAIHGKVMVVGTGAIGLAVARWAHHLGAEEVIVLGRGEKKRAIVERLEGVCYLAHSCEGEQWDADVVFEAVGTVDALTSALHLAAPGGSIVLVGNPQGDMRLVQETYWKILRKQLRLYGSWNSSYHGFASSDWADVIRAVSAGTIHVDQMITHYYHQEDIFTALNMMKEHKEPYCKVMTLWNGCDEEESQCPKV